MCGFPCTAAFQPGGMSAFLLASAGFVTNNVTTAGTNCAAYNRTFNIVANKRTGNCTACSTYYSTFTLLTYTFFFLSSCTEIQ